MNLAQATSMAELRRPVHTTVKPRTLSAVKVAEMVLARCAKNGYPYKYHTPDSWAKKFLDSKEFTLMEIDLTAAASAHNPRSSDRVAHYLKCNAAEFDPGVVDTNKRKAGRSHLGYVPEVIVTDGKHRKAAMLAQGHTKWIAWVGCKAVKKLKRTKTIEASALKPTQALMQCFTKMDSHLAIFASVTPSSNISVPRQDTGTGGPTGMKEELNAGGPGSGRKPVWGVNTKNTATLDKFHSTLVSRGYKYAHSGGNPESDKGRGHTYVNKALGEQKHFVEYSNGNHTRWPSQKIKASETKACCEACGARSSGTLSDPSASDMKVPPDASDDGSHVSESDRQSWNADRPQIFVPGTGPGYARRFSVDPAVTSPGSGVGPRVINKGASRSEMSRVLEAKGVKVPKIWNKKKRKMECVAPPGFSEDTMHKMKKKLGTEGAFKVAWYQHNKSKKN